MTAPMKWFETLHPFFRGMVWLVIMTATGVSMVIAMQRDISANAQGNKDNAAQIEVIKSVNQDLRTGQAVLEQKIDSGAARDRERARRDTERQNDLKSSLDRILRRLDNGAHRDPRARPH